jgi:hypothetical protein
MMEFQPGDLVTYKDQFTQNGNFDGSVVLLVLKTRIPDSRTAAPPRVFVHNLKSGSRGWDFADGYIKLPKVEEQR